MSELTMRRLPTLCRRCFPAALVLVSSLVLSSTARAEPDILARVKKQGFVRCAVDFTPGFSSIDQNGRHQGFDTDFCRAIAAAALGDANAIRLERVSLTYKFQALAAGDIDVAMGMTTWTYKRDTGTGAAFTMPTYFDGQSFLVWSDSPYTSPDKLKGVTVCARRDSTSVGTLLEYDKRLKLGVKIVEANSIEDRIGRFTKRECEVMTGDRTELELTRLRYSGIHTINRWRVLPGEISREPIGPYVAAHDPRWNAIVRWVINVTQIAELRSITSNTIASIGAEADGELRRLAGLEGDFGKSLGLKDDWARQVIAQVGNYGEIFDRNIGVDSPFSLERGPNRPTSSGGYFFPPPLR